MESDNGPNRSLARYPVALTPEFMDPGVSPRSSKLLHSTDLCYIMACIQYDSLIKSIHQSPWQPTAALPSPAYLCHQGNTLPDAGVFPLLLSPIR